MKKTLLATAIAGALGVTAAAQAATVYDQDGTQVDVYGRINYAITTADPDSEGKASGSEFRDVFSRFGFRARHQVSSDLNVFANMEFRPNLDRQNTESMTVRNSFVGLQGDSWGRVQIGNFDGVIYQNISSAYEIHELYGYTTLVHAYGARGDSIAYSTPNLSGFQAHLQAKHVSGNGSVVGSGDNSSTTSWQTALTYELAGLKLGLGYNQSENVFDRADNYGYDGPGSNPAGEDIWLASVMYDFTPDFTMGLKYEEVTDEFDPDYVINNNTGATAGGNIEKLWTLVAKYDYGMGSIYADYNRAEVLGDYSDRDIWTVGANYRFSKPMYVWAEVTELDLDVEDGSGQVDDTIFSLGVRYDF